MTPFLKAVADSCAARYDDMSRFCFVFPNKRSGSFFLKHLRQMATTRPMLAPHVTTVTDLVTDLSQLVIDSRIDMLFTLYNEYVALMDEDARDDRPPVEFDAFRAWGDVVLSDFNEVDMYAVDAEALFRNVRQYHDIRSDFLTEEQRKVMEEYFGVPDYEAAAGRFWKSMEYDSKRADKHSTDVKRRFLHLWEALWPLYRRFNSRLEERGLAYPGAAFKKAIGRVHADGREAFGYEKVFFVGFNALTAAEWMLFSGMRRLMTETSAGREPLAGFFWDFSGPLLTAQDNSASRFMRLNVKHFPMPEWADMSGCEPSSLPDVMKVISSPSNSAQTKIIGEILGDMRRSLPPSAFREARVAVVLPDENLLLPLLYSFPEEIGDINLTMGYPLRLTSAVTFVSLLRKMQSHCQHAAGVHSFLTRDIDTLMAHPLMHAISGSDAIGRLRGHIAAKRLFSIDSASVSGFLPDAAPLFNVLEADTTVAGAIGYLDAALSLAERAVGGGCEDSRIKARLDIEYIGVYRNALRRLASAVGTHGVEMSWPTLYRLADRLIAGETVTFEGEPLQGLQVMGLLETRSLDFDHVIIPSMNERIFPRRMRQRSFIPETLRKGFAMASSSYQESIFSYYFYRLIGRAKTVTMLYDARSGGLRSSEPSRYVQQLKHLFARGRVIFEERRFDLAPRGEVPAVIEKDARVMSVLEKYCVKDSGYNFSASALMKYFSCPMSFYFEYVAGIRPDDEPQEYIDPVTMGNIFHAMMEEVYLFAEERGHYLPTGKLMTAGRLETVLADAGALEALVRRNVNRHYFRLPLPECDRPLAGSAAMVADKLLRLFVHVLRHDLSLTPFTLYGCEVKDTLMMPLPSGRRINVRFSFDRLDKIDTPSGPVMRIVDYKTGGVHVKADGMDDVFSGEADSKQIFQLMLYANLYNLMVCGSCGTGSDIPVRTEIYGVQKVVRNSTVENLPVISEIDRKPFAVHTEVNDAFLRRFYDEIEALFSPDVPFVQTDRQAACSFCAFRAMCGR